MSRRASLSQLLRPCSNHGQHPGPLQPHLRQIRHAQGVCQARSHAPSLTGSAPGPHSMTQPSIGKQQQGPSLLRRRTVLSQSPQVPPEHRASRGPSPPLRRSPPPMWLPGPFSAPWRLAPLLCRQGFSPWHMLELGPTVTVLGRADPSQATPATGPLASPSTTATDLSAGPSPATVHAPVTAPTFLDAAHDCGVHQSHCVHPPPLRRTADLWRPALTSRGPLSQAVGSAAPLSGCRHLASVQGRSPHSPRPRCRGVLFTHPCGRWGGAQALGTPWVCWWCL
ncbi:hypothetical protein NDU88_002103 [Pleurodeles waltl]|uniref:Uncharacterized protein n=1 Tax=Pleurodeles waltl TaxID=8319 RepID=A0AAV7M775_PLEWA|nr:hypothetical protein NDU88_002103 [Pleurodeles waltl]